MGETIDLAPAPPLGVEVAAELPAADGEKGVPGGFFALVGVEIG